MLQEEYELSADEIRHFRDIKKRICEKMYGIDAVINALLIALVTRGHILLEGNPGLGKTVLIKTLCEKLGLPSSAVGRIQFTPDLMPSDITGTKFPNDDGKLEFQKGPIFCNLLLADEINRATPKTQAAMLEAMAELQVTVLGEKYQLTKLEEVIDETKLSVQTPFLVMATQNPIDQEGTYQLPEAQLDRFLFKVRMPFPDSEILQKIVDKALSEGIRANQNQELENSKDWQKTLAMIQRMSRSIRSAKPSDSVKTHILNIVMASNADKLTQVMGLSKDQLSELESATKNVEYGLGPRAAIYLTLATLGWAALELVSESEAASFTHKSTEALANVAIPVLRHRIKIRPPINEAIDGNESFEDMHDELIRQFIVNCAPNDENGYRQNFEAALDVAKQKSVF